MFLESGINTEREVYVSLVGTEHIWYYFEQAPTSFVNTAAVKKLPNMRGNQYGHTRCRKLQICAAIVKEVE